MRRSAAHIFAQGLVLILKGTRVKWRGRWAPTHCPASVQGCRRHPCWLESSFYDPWQETWAHGWSGGWHLSAVELPLWFLGSFWIGDVSDRCSHLCSVSDGKDDIWVQHYCLKSWNDVNNHCSNKEMHFRWEQWVWRWITFFLAGPTARNARHQSFSAGMLFDSLGSFVHASGVACVAIHGSRPTLLTLIVLCSLHKGVWSQSSIGTTTFASQPKQQ